MKFTLAYTGIRVRDFDRSLAFYSGTLGMRVLRQADDPSTKGRYAMLKSDGSEDELEINWYADGSPVARTYPDGEGEELDHVAFEVEDFDGAVEYLRERGHPLVMGPIVDDDFKVAYVRDPDGIWVELYQKRL